MSIFSRLTSWFPRFSFFEGPLAYWRLALVFILFPLTELVGLWTYSFLLSWFGTFLLCLFLIVKGLLGAFLTKFQIVRYWDECQRQIRNGETPTYPVSHTALVLVASALLITPGFISNLIGLLLLLPPVRSVVIDYVQRRLDDPVSKNQRSSSPESPDVIDIK